MRADDERVGRHFKLSGDTHRAHAPHRPAHGQRGRSIGLGVDKNHCPGPAPLCRKSTLRAAASSTHTKHSDSALERGGCLFFLPSQAHGQTFDGPVAFHGRNRCADPAG